MRWIESYRAKRMTADEAVQVVRSGNRVWIHEGCGTPQVLVDALMGRALELRNVELCHMLTFGQAPYTWPEFEMNFRHNGLFLGGNTRDAVAEGRADYTPIFLSEIEALFQSGQLSIDVALIQTGPPDQYGFVSLGTSVDCTLTAARCAKYVIAEVNRQMPRTHGDTFLPVDRISAFVETNRPLLQLPVEAPTSVQHAIARNVASLIPDGAVLQTGIGAVADAVLSSLKDRRALGVHSEMCSDGVIDLIEAGVLTGELKNIHRGKIVIGFVLGTKRLFDFIHENPMFEMHPTFYTNDPFIIAANDRMVAINSALQVDLTGQVCADSIGTKPYSGFGGQVDFIRGAARSKGGKPIIALPSTACHETVSRIAPMLDRGAGVVTSRGDVHYVVTEYGIAYLHGKTLRQRAEALIAIAHPKFHNELFEYAEKTHLLDTRGALALQEA
ncbi:MAG TPA: acetyl-CoA hydrolase/transferase C-terminal domain-containing protein [Bryobacteraceae bacterium]|nr:acetyl-CoA hydrolase/transferase C-terminal domain-containing protein [Bryobacteraceae bacterium]